jgi:hypothetical protein
MLTVHGWAQMNTNDVFVLLDTVSPEQDARLVDALDAFVGQRLRDAAADDGDAFGVMLRTSFDSAGRLNKKLTFQNREWADDFMAYWATQQSALETA